MRWRTTYEWSTALALSGLLAFAGLAGACSSSEANSAEDAATTGAPLEAVADTDNDPGRVARVALVDGEVAVKPVGVEDWEDASLNDPVFEGYEVYAPDGARSELMLGDAKYARFGDGAAVTLARFDPDWAQLELASGTMTLALDQYTDGEYYEVSAPGGALVPREAGSYRVDVLPDGSSRVTVLRGYAVINTPDGTFEAHAGDVVDLGYQPANVQVYSAAAPQYHDAWDDWSYSRDQYYQGYYNDVPEPVQVFEGRNDIYGIIGLAAFGVWQALDNDRYVWVPNDSRRAGWAPYQNGYWDYSPVVGWTWISNDPWGWAPYHYGRWDYVDQYGWCWAPYHGDRVASYSVWRERYDWRPAEVYVWQPPQTNYYAWVPLAPGEPYVPYNTALVSQPRVVTTANFRPRYLREHRAVYYVTDQQLYERVHPRRAERAEIERFADPRVARLNPARLPKPNRVVAEKHRARISVPQQIRQRPVVVTEASANRPSRLRKNAPAVAAERQRPVRKAQNKPLRVDRKPASQATGRNNAPRGVEVDRGNTRIRQVQPHANKQDVQRPNRNRTPKPNATPNRRSNPKAQQTARPPQGRQQVNRAERPNATRARQPAQVRKNVRQNRNNNTVRKQNQVRARPQARSNRAPKTVRRQRPTRARQQARPNRQPRTVRRQPATRPRAAKQPVTVRRANKPQRVRNKANAARSKKNDNRPPRARRP